MQSDIHSIDNVQLEVAGFLYNLSIFFEKLDKFSVVLNIHKQSKKLRNSKGSDG